MRPAANVGRMRVLVLDHVSGKPSFVKVHRVCAVPDETQLEWCEIACCTTEACRKTTVILANPVLARSSNALCWRLPAQLGFLDDKLHGLQVHCFEKEDCLDTASRSSSLPSINEDRELISLGNDGRHSSSSVSKNRTSMCFCDVSVSEVSLAILGKAIAHTPPMLVAIELEVSHPLLVGCSGLDPTNPWVAVLPFTYQMPNFKCSI
eukprot:gnl/MRDRNA2_/MRDRNA2_304243_c0_seq1.p1 gnl/MRDRNA2_/MRDRNA2_304243_c0~~gnl/MRDRNA2_/MRDRNA2_304243_c0_seq1.p1  ORF type:complete len:224 (-),score=17.46 gnl/MRDRNA2_/MRDRNA2_304243_c0_seq1:175-795(-)